ncbi:class I SAM-dependent methyltransferase [Sulfurovum sp. TSL1]|uniref:class I SAM-dependent methyltransferase n=1 Tax=Sulfurovum sp. TSL1 TaxID=2826994 RepID=UPI001CC6FEFC|nr:class I SAM-dependent methyltransferase [Sulfurovum sp. TSL1]GIT97641.1 methyltransferase type 12 [Sulfurovum sp. TSL1]
MTFTIQSMQEIITTLSMKAKVCEAGKIFCFEIVDPDLGEGYAGEVLEIKGESYIYRGYKAWTDLAELLMCKMMTPQKSTYPRIRLTFKKLERQSSFHTAGPSSSKEEKYGVDSHFSQIHKMEEPAFLYYYTQALQNAKLNQRRSILNLGINTGDEFSVIKNSLDIHTYEKMKLVGVDHSKSAINYAESCFPEENVTLYAHDINDLERLDLGRFDLLVSIGTLQSPSINFKPFFMSLVQNHLEKDAAVILGFPNSRWIGGEMIYGAKAPNYAMSEMSLLFNDVIFCKKYLQQKKFRVTLTGKQYIFLTATKII